MKAKLSFKRAFTEAFSYGVKNALSVWACYILWLVTIWIPYINVGTTIAISMLPVEMAKGRIVNPLHIFAGKYRRYMGEYIILSVLMTAGILLAMFFMFFPAIVIALAWSLAVYYLVERGMNPIAALKKSNDATYGSKWKIFFCSLCLNLLLGAIMVIAMLGCGGCGGDECCTPECRHTAFMVIAYISAFVFAPVLMGLNASIWNQLKDNVE